MLDVRRRALLAAAAAGVVGMPYFMSTTGVTGWFSGSDGSEQVAAEGEGYSGPTGSASVTGSPLGGPPVEGYPVAHLGEVLHFGVTPEWVTIRWPKVYTLTNATERAGYRVPVVTGSAESDLAGSLTYYFDASDQLQSIEFHGTTGDPRTLVQLVTTQHGLSRQETQSATRQVYQQKWGGKAVSELRVETAAVISSATPHRRYHIHLLLARPQERGWFAPARQPTSGVRL